VSWWEYILNVWAVILGWEGTKWVGRWANKPENPRPYSWECPYYDGFAVQGSNMDTINFVKDDHLQLHNEVSEDFDVDRNSFAYLPEPVAWASAEYIEGRAAADKGELHGYKLVEGEYKKLEGPAASDTYWSHEVDLYK
jgi:hypothetical protein